MFLLKLRLDAAEASPNDYLSWWVGLLLNRKKQGANISAPSQTTPREATPDGSARSMLMAPSSELRALAVWHQTTGSMLWTKSGLDKRRAAFALDALLAIRVAPHASGALRSLLTLHCCHTSACSNYNGKERLLLIMCALGRDAHVMKCDHSFPIVIRHEAPVT